MDNLFPIQKCEDLRMEFKGWDAYLLQEVMGVVDAVTWYLRNCGAIWYWAAYSTTSKTLLAAAVVEDLKWPSQEWLDEVDAKWRKLAQDPEAELEEQLEGGSDVSHELHSDQVSPSRDGEMGKETVVSVRVTNTLVS